MQRAIYIYIYIYTMACVTLKRISQMSARRGTRSMREIVQPLRLGRQARPSNSGGAYVVSSSEVMIRGFSEVILRFVRYMELQTMIDLRAGTTNFTKANRG